MKQEEFIQKAIEDTVELENHKIEELDKDFFRLTDELKKIERYLSELGFDSKDSDLIPEFLDKNTQAEYMKLLDDKSDIIKKINNIKGDLHIYKHSQEN